MTDNVVLAGDGTANGSNGNTGWINFDPMDKGNTSLSIPFSSGLISVVAGHTYAFAAESDINAYMSGDTNPVPEPSTIVLFGSGIAGLYLLRKRSRSPNLA